MSEIQPKVRLVLQRPEGELQLTWVSPRSLGLHNGASREVLTNRGSQRGVELRCPPGITAKVAEAIRSGEVKPQWSMARVCELPDGDTMLIRNDTGSAVVTTDRTGGTFCPANEWWIAVVRS